MAIGPEINYFAIDGQPSPVKEFKGFMKVPHDFSKVSIIKKVSDEAFFYQQVPRGPDHPAPKLYKQSEREKKSKEIDLQKQNYITIIEMF